MDLDRGQLQSYLGNYDLYLTTKEENPRVEALQNELFDKRLAQEECGFAKVSRLAVQEMKGECEH